MSKAFKYIQAGFKLLEKLSHKQEDSPEPSKNLEVTENVRFTFQGYDVVSYSWPDGQRLLYVVQYQETGDGVAAFLPTFDPYYDCYVEAKTEEEAYTRLQEEFKQVALYVLESGKLLPMPDFNSQDLELVH